MAAASDKVSVIVLLLDDDEEEERAYKISKRSIWTRPWLLRRKTDGAFHTLFKELKAEHSERFKGYVRMDVPHFDELGRILSPLLYERMYKARGSVLSCLEIPCQWRIVSIFGVSISN